MHRQKQILGYGVMVTLQILVLSFLVRSQVAQLKRLFFRVAFFVSSYVMFARGRSSYACRVLLVLLMRASFHNHPTPLQAILLQTANRRLLNCRSWVLVCLILMFVGWADIIMIYCSPYGLRWFYNGSALLCNSCTIAAVRIQVAQLKRLFFRVAFFVSSSVMFARGRSAYACRVVSHNWCKHRFANIAPFEGRAKKKSLDNRLIIKAYG